MTKLHVVTHGGVMRTGDLLGEVRIPWASLLGPLGQNASFWCC